MSELFKIKLEEILSTRRADVTDVSALTEVAPWALRIAGTYSAEEALYVYEKLQLVGSQSLYCAFCSSENWGNGGATTWVETLSKTHAVACANRHSCSWVEEQLSKKAAQISQKVIEHTTKYGVVWEIPKAAPSRKEFAAWLTSQFPEIPTNLDCRLVVEFILRSPSCTVVYSDGKVDIALKDLESTMAQRGPRGFVGFLEPTVN